MDRRPFAACGARQKVHIMLFCSSEAKSVLQRSIIDLRSSWVDIWIGRGRGARVGQRSEETRDLPTKVKDISRVGARLLMLPKRSRIVICYAERTGQSKSLFLFIIDLLFVLRLTRFLRFMILDRVVDVAEDASNTILV